MASHGGALRLRAVGGLAAVAAFTAWAVVASGAFAVPNAAAAATGQTTTGDPAAGEAIYLSTCAACHGVHAEGTKLAPDLRPAGTAVIDLMLRTGRMPLPETGQPVLRRPQLLSDAQIADVVAYLAPLTSGPPIPPAAMVTGGGDLAEGRHLFTANCAACHGATGAGDAIGAGIIAPDLSKSTSRDVAEAVTGGPIPMPRFSFSPDQLRSIEAYVEYLRSAPHPGGTSVTAVGPVAEGFVAGAVGLVMLLAIVRWVGRADPQAQRRPAPADDEPFEPAEPSAGGPA